MIMEELKVRIPFPEGTKFKIIKPKLHELFEETRYALDLIVEVGTPVLAVREGKVVWVKSDSNKYFRPADLSALPLEEIKEIASKYTNGVCIKHPDGTFAEYLHLDKNVKVKVGDWVEEGEIIGYVGFSGILEKPHLHLNIFVLSGNRAKSIPFSFNYRYKRK